MKSWTSVEKMPIKLIYLITTLTHGGTERNLVQYCQALDKSKYDLEVWYLYDVENSQRGKIESSGVRLRCLGASGGFKLRFLISAARELARSGADIIHIFLPTVAYYGVASKLLFRSRIPMLFSSGGVQLVLPFQLQMMKFGVGRYCHPIICNSNFVRNFWIEKGVDESRMRVICNGHDLQKYEISETRDELRTAYGIGPDDFFILSVGRLIASKRIPDLLKACSCLKESEDANIVLRIAGDGPEMDSLRREAVEFNLNPDQVLLGNRKDVLKLMVAADVFAFPSESEGSPNAVIEAAFTKLPVVVSDIDPCREVIRDQESGLIFETGNVEQLRDGIRKILHDREFGSRLAKAAYDSSLEKYELSATMAKLEQAYQIAMNPVLELERND